MTSGSSVLSDAARRAGWGWVRWLPHARPGSTPTPSLLGTEQDSVGRRLAELAALVDARAELAATTRCARPRTCWSCSTAPAGCARCRPWSTCSAAAPAVGVRVLCLDDEVRQLPEECRAVVACERRTGPDRGDLVGATPTDIVPDLVEAPWCETVARAVSAAARHHPRGGGRGHPVVGPAARADRPRPAHPRGRRRALAARGRTTDVVVGVGYDGPFRVDLRRDGPHALVAGTTGSGKSELLQTLVASLAVANRPDELTFVLVDYKGGSAFKDCARLPHTVGMVTDLDAHLVSRALVSLGAELRRREHLLAGARGQGPRGLLGSAAHPARPAGRSRGWCSSSTSSPALAAELPDFVHGLVGIAQRGRSLGIHLVLATQRPSGVVSADIRANTNLRIALRVTDETDSRDVIDAPDAARILKRTSRAGPSPAAAPRR